MSFSNSVQVSLKSISNIANDNATFFIDAYQRGYRWTKNEVRDLLEDIREFSQTNYKGFNGEKERFYCLQPIIVTESENGWKVIDGQQRLTTIYLIYSYYITFVDGKMTKGKLPFKLKYKNKPVLEQCISEISDKNFNGDFDKFKKYYSDIDCYFLVEAYKEINRYFTEIFSNLAISGQAQDMKSVFDNYMKVIWYQLDNCSHDEEINLFTKINIGKIPLTNSELIKALLLKNEENSLLLSKQENIAVKWDEIEAKLLDEAFWSFLVNSHSYSTRIDFLFDVMANEINEILKQENIIYYVEKDFNTKYFSFYVFNNYIKYLKKTGIDSFKIVESIWDRICEYYRMFLDWYSNRTWYHLIGFIIYNSKDNIGTIYKLSKIYKSNNTGKGHKTYFETKLKEIAKETLIGKDDLDTLEDFVISQSYGDNSSNRKIHNILLMYNIAALESEEQIDVRFAFDKYKKKKCWDLEHINAIADERPSDDKDTNENECLVWINNVLTIPEVKNIIMPNGRTVNDNALNIIQNKLYLPKNNDRLFVELYETVINSFNQLQDINKIGNLTLLDSGVNRSYKNDIFPLKRKTIIDKCCKDIYMPLCTKKVFLKAYSDATNLLKWTQDDFDNYVKDINEKIIKYLK